jgi:hypothetical protein
LSVSFADAASPEGVPPAVGVALSEGEAVGVPAAEGVAVGVPAAEGEPGAEAEAEGERLGDALREGVTPPMLRDAEAVLLPLGVALDVALDVRERVAVTEGEAPELSVPVGVA